MDYLLIAGAAVIGILVGYLISLRRARVAVAEELVKARKRADQALQTARAGVANELEEKDRTIAALEARMAEAGQQAEQERSKLRADLTHLQTERTRLAARTQELSQHVDEMRGEMRTISDEGMRELEELHEILNALEQAVQRMEERRLAADRKLKKEAAPPQAPVAAPKA
jgi:chromosome segregation ATPase